MCPRALYWGRCFSFFYINDICSSSKLLHFILYADDTNIFYSCENIDDLCRIVNVELGCVMQWFISNRLSVNIKKTNYVLFGNQAKLKNITNCKIVMENIEIVQTKLTNTARFLGVSIDSNLTWKDHIDSFTKKLQNLWEL